VSTFPLFLAGYFKKLNATMFFLAIMCSG